LGDERDDNDPERNLLIEDYELQSYVPVPVGGNPVTDTVDLKGVWGTVRWRQDGSEKPPAIFAEGEKYRATITLGAKSGYIFAADKDFTYASGVDSVKSSPTGDKSTERVLEVVYNIVRNSTDTVDNRDLSRHIPVPLAGAKPTREITGDGYTGVIRWKEGVVFVDALEKFAAGVEYTALVTLYANEGYSFNGVPASGADGAFSHKGARELEHGPGGNDRLLVRLSFDPSAQGIIYVEDYNLQHYVPFPVPDVEPKETEELEDLSISVKWKHPDGTPVTDKFISTTYMAEITLRTKGFRQFYSDKIFGYKEAGITTVRDDRGATIRKLTVQYANAVEKDPLVSVDLTDYIPLPKTAALVERSFTVSRSDGIVRLDGIVSWKEVDEDGNETAFNGTVFQPEKLYKAYITLFPAPGYTPEDLEEIVIEKYKGGWGAELIGDGNGNGEREIKGNSVTGISIIKFPKTKKQEIELELSTLFPRFAYK
jgi:hypothetical protein